jgi:hypothetical protein
MRHALGIGCPCETRLIVRRVRTTTVSLGVKRDKQLVRTCRVGVSKSSRVLQPGDVRMNNRKA